MDGHSRADPVHRGFRRKADQRAAHARESPGEIILRGGRLRLADHRRGRLSRSKIAAFVHVDPMSTLRTRCTRAPPCPGHRPAGLDVGDKEPRRLLQVVGRHEDAVEPHGGELFDDGLPRGLSHHEVAAHVQDDAVQPALDAAVAESGAVDLPVAVEGGDQDRPGAGLDCRVDELVLARP